MILEGLVAHPLTSMGVGALVTWLAARYYFKKAGDDLRDEAKGLHAASTAIAYMLEHRDADVEVRRDAQGRVTGLVVKARGEASLTFNVRGAMRDFGEEN